MTAASAPQILSSDEGKTIGVVGDIYRFLLTGEQTGGHYAMFEATVLPGGGPPPHIHRNEDEAFYVIEGEITFFSGEERFLAGPGTTVNMPIGNPHAFKNETDRPAKMIISYSPAGLENFFFEIGVPFSGDNPPVPSQAEIDRLIEAAPRYGIEFIHPSDEKQH